VRFLFAGHELDADRRELRRGGDLMPVEPQVFDLLLYLIRNRDRVVSKDDLIAGVWGGRIVSDSTLTSRINAARKAVADSGEQQQLIRTIPRKGLRFVGDVGEAGTPPAAEPASVAQAVLHAPLPQQQVSFCRAGDGANIAYAALGNGPPLVKTGTWLTHLEYDWQSPVWQPFLRELAAGRRLIRYDARGNGLSDWDVADISFEAFLCDLDCVVEAAGLEQFALFGMSQGAALSIAYAVRHPGRVSHLVICGGYARGRRMRSSPDDAAQSEAIITLMRQGWGRDNPAFRQIFTSLFIPGGTAKQMQWFNDLQRITTSPDNAVRMRTVMDDIDVTDLLSQVKVPTLVLHSREDALVPFDEGRRIAAGIKGARFVALESRNHVLLDSEPAWSRFFAEIRVFLAG